VDEKTLRRENVLMMAPPHLAAFLRNHDIPLTALTLSSTRGILLLLARVAHWFVYISKAKKLTRKALFTA
jgi:hypothetical protein